MSRELIKQGEAGSGDLNGTNQILETVLEGGADLKLRAWNAILLQARPHSSHPHVHQDSRCILKKRGSSKGRWYEDYEDSHCGLNS